jgi:NAD(P)-dependent dehydrogenase (short-subunit alcohol dehydrogenase family)
MTDTTGKVAFVTGGSSGIGLGLTRAFLDAGSKVAITYRNADRLAGAIAEVPAAQRGRLHAIRVDITDREAMQRAAAETVSVFGKVHILCNNAGVNALAAADSATIEDWRSMLEVNFFSVICALDAFLPHIKAHGEGGHVLNTGSMASFIAMPQSATYSAAKFALRALTEALRSSLARDGIGVSLLCPGLVKTNIHAAMIDAVARQGEDAPLRSQRERMRTAQIAQLKAMQAVGMDPLEVGRMALEGIRRNDAYVFTHPEFREDFEELHRSIAALLPDGDVPSARRELEQRRRGSARRP